MDIPTRLLFVINFMSQVRNGNFQRLQSKFEISIF